MNPRDKTQPAPLDDKLQLDVALACTTALIANPTDQSFQLKPGETCAHGTARLGCDFAAAFLKRLYPDRALTLLS